MTRERRDANARQPPTPGWIGRLRPGPGARPPRPTAIAPAKPPQATPARRAVVRGDFRQRRQDKPSLMGARMRQGQALGDTLLRAEGDQVEVQGPGLVGYPFGPAAELAFQRLQLVQERLGRFAGPGNQQGHRVDKPGRSERAIHRGAAPERGAAQRPGAERFQPVQGRTQQCGGLAQIRTQGNHGGQNRRRDRKPQAGGCGRSDRRLGRTRRGLWLWAFRLHFSPSTSCMSYTPGGRPTTQRAARSAPWAKVSRLEARWVSSRRSPGVAKITV